MEMEDQYIAINIEHINLGSTIGKQNGKFRNFFLIFEYNEVRKQTNSPIAQLVRATDS